MNDWSRYPNLLRPDCPWVPLRQATGLPNVKWCEETLCSWVAEPANTWSNLAFLVVAGVLFWLVRRETDRLQRFWAPTAFWVGTTSLVYHASVTFLTQVFDFWGMYFFFVLAVLLNLLRLGTVTRARFFPWLWGLIFALTGFTVVVAKVGLPVQGIIVALIVLTLVTEVLATRKATGKVDHRFLAGALTALVVGAIFSASDGSGRWCVPENHIIQGHAIWHCFTATGVFLAYFHYRQFKNATAAA